MGRDNIHNDPVFSAGSGHGAVCISYKEDDETVEKKIHLKEIEWSAKFLRWCRVWRCCIPLQSTDVKQQYVNEYVQCLDNKLQPPMPMMAFIVDDDEDADEREP